MKIIIIAEIGINHNGDIDIAKQLIDVAVVAGCDAVKFQKRTIQKVYSEEELNKYRESPWGKSNRDQKKGLEFDLSDYQEIDKYCTKKSIKWFASAWDLESLEFLRKFDCKYNKIASAMIMDLEFLEEVAKEKKYCFISTGMCEERDIKKAVEIFEKNKCPYELMHCVSTYPAKPEDINLNYIDQLRKIFNCKIGYSGHEIGTLISVAACAKGATSLERHITLDKTMYGSDQSASLEQNGLNQLVSAIRKIEISLGDGKKKFLESEIPISNKLRSHIKKYVKR
jgi:N-acetylneuraminate synthase